MKPILRMTFASILTQIQRVPELPESVRPNASDSGEYIFKVAVLNPIYDFLLFTGGYSLISALESMIDSFLWNLCMNCRYSYVGVMTLGWRAFHGGRYKCGMRMQ